MSRNTKRLPQDATQELVEKYHQAFLGNERYAMSELTVQFVFDNCRDNSCMKNILIKACVLNSLYSTNIRAIYAVAQRVLSLNIDQRLRKGDKALVNEIAQTRLNKDTERGFYSFASKYCHFHNNDAYPIYDSFVEDVLVHYQIKSPFMGIPDQKKSSIKKNIREHLKRYESFWAEIEGLKQKYGLQPFSTKEIDHFLWGYGRALYPRNYGKQR
jgi:hypothetical protein